MVWTYSRISEVCTGVILSGACHKLLTACFLTYDTSNNIRSDGLCGPGGRVDCSKAWTCCRVFLLWALLKNWKPLVSPWILAGATFLGVKCVASKTQSGQTRSCVFFLLVENAKCSNFFYFGFFDLPYSSFASPIMDKVECNKPITRWLLGPPRNSALVPAVGKWGT